jgi:hypothetical protein
VPFLEPPPAAAWQHRDARIGFEAVFFAATDTGYRIDGSTSAAEDGEIWAVAYEIAVDAEWRTRRVRIWGRSATTPRTRVLTSDGAGHWVVDGAIAPHLDGCLDVDLESSAATNALPIHRMDLDLGSTARTPAAYIRCLDLAVERLEQTYTRVTDDGGNQCYDYTAPAFSFASRLSYDGCGLLVSYPGIAVRAA